MGRNSGRTVGILATKSMIASSVLMAWFSQTGLFIQLCWKQSECNNLFSFQFRVTRFSSFRSRVITFSGPPITNNCAGGCGPGIQRLPLEIPTWCWMLALRFSLPCARQPMTTQTSFIWMSGSFRRPAPRDRTSAVRRQRTFRETFQRRYQKKYNNHKD
jgi:hypothetical protein